MSNIRSDLIRHLSLLALIAAASVPFVLLYALLSQYA